MGCCFGLPGLALSYVTYRHSFSLLSVADDHNAGGDAEVDDAHLLQQSKDKSNKRGQRGSRTAFDEI